MSGSIPSVSVVMRSKNSAWVIGEALRALFSQDYDDFDLLLVDSGSTDRTLDIARHYPCRILSIDPKSYHPGPVLNRAVAETRGAITVFQNSDAIPRDPQTLSRLLRAFEDSDVQAAFARQVPRPEAATWVRRDYAVAFPESGDPPSWLPFSLPLAAMRRSIWRERGFYEDAWGSEDIEWGWWAARQGVRIRYVPDAVATHSHNYTLRQLYGRFFIEGEAAAFIHREPDSTLRMLGRLLSSCARDAVYHLREGDPIGLPAVPFRRFVQHWAHFRGHRLGERRIATRDSDITTGQRIVLERHEARDRAGS